jgi:hypothetical protein
VAFRAEHPILSSRKDESINFKIYTPNDPNQRTDNNTERFFVKMSATLEATRPANQKKTFGKSTREVPHHSQKASKWYPAEDEAQHKKVGVNILPRVYG